MTGKLDMIKFDSDFHLEFLQNISLSLCYFAILLLFIYTTGFFDNVNLSRNTLEHVTKISEAS